MVSSIFTSTAQRLGGLVIEEAKYLYAVKDKIERLQRDLQWMQCFLEDADNKQHHDKVVALWVADVRDFAYEGEDLIEGYLHQVSHRRHNGLWSSIKWFSCILGDARALLEVGLNIDDLRTRISKLVSRMQMFGIQITRQSESSTYDFAIREQRRTYSHIEEDPIGLEAHIEEVVHKLVMKKEIKVVGICGMGGLGKTTLARQVFQNTAIKKHFRNNCVWVYISKQFERIDIYREILIRLATTKDVHGRMEINALTIGELPEKICEVLKEKECLVVLDDVWGNGDWDILEPTFQSIRSSGSKILITTHDNGLLHHIDPNGYSHPFGILSEEDSWRLLQRIAFMERRNIDDDVKAKMKKLGMEMLKRCEGLPLAIIALGGILSTKKTVVEWQIVQKNITSYLMSHMEQDSHEGKGLSAVLELSYYDLPYYLKPCFMYLGTFPEDHELHAPRLYHLWEAEGLVTISANGRVENQGVSLDDIAESYLDQLAKRSMVQVEQHYDNGRILSCRLHDVMRDMCLKKCKEVSFLNVIECGSLEEQSDTPVDTKLCRCALHLREGMSDDAHFDPNNTPCIRSLLVFQRGYAKVEKLITQSMSNFFTLLRVLDLEGTGIREPIDVIGKFIHLRYMSFRGVKISNLPSSIWDCKTWRPLTCGVI